MNNEQQWPPEETGKQRYRVVYEDAKRALVGHNHASAGLETRDVAVAISWNAVATSRAPACLMSRKITGSAGANQRIVSVISMNSRLFALARGRGVVCRGWRM